MRPISSTSRATACAISAAIPTIADGRLYATVDELKKMRDLADANGISIDCLAPPFLASSHIDREKHPAIMLAQSPERDRDIEAMQTLIRNCAAAGIPSIKYNMSILGVLRTGRSPGRGDATYSTWSLKNAHPENPLTRAGHVTADMAWERITYFLEKIIPVAAEYKVRMACHPHDPGVPPEGYQGVTRVLGHGGRVEALRLDQGEPVSRPQLLPGHGIGNAPRSRQGNLRRDPLLRLAPEDLQRALPQYPRPPRRVRRDLSRTKATWIS